VAPTIAISILQSARVANYYTTIGYLVGIISILSLSITPRGKFLQTWALNIIFACLGAAVALLVMWSSLQARLHTESRPLNPSTGLPAYNSSQSAVSGVWLFVLIWFANMIRSEHPSIKIPVIIFCIFINISCTSSPNITTTAAAEALVKKILTTMLTALGIGGACSLLILPVPSRKVTFGQMRGLVMMMRGAIKQEKLYMQSLEREDMFAKPHDVSSAVDEGRDGRGGSKSKSTSAEAEPVTEAEARALKATISGIRELAGKVQADLEFAKRDFSWGKFDAMELTVTFLKIRSCLIPIIGMSTLIDIFQRVAERRHWVTDSRTPAEVIAEKKEEKRLWNEVMRQLHDPFEVLSEIVDQGLEHAAIQLELLPRPKAAKKRQQGQSNEAEDVEAKAGVSNPGDADFGRGLEDKINSLKVSSMTTIELHPEAQGWRV
jgi:hypothetical protein